MMIYNGFRCGGSRKRETSGVNYLLLIFLTGCVVGWGYEEVFCWFTEGVLRNRGILNGPWLPICGIGTLGVCAMKPLGKQMVRKADPNAVCVACRVLLVLFLADCVLSALLRTPISY